MVGFFEHLDITYSLYVDARVNYIDCILKGVKLTKFKSMLISCKDNTMKESEENWTTGEAKNMLMDVFESFFKEDRLDPDGYGIPGMTCCKGIEQDLCCKLGN